MYKKLVLVLVAVSLLVACGVKNRKSYLYDNHRFNYVKLEKFKGAGDRNITQPTVFSEPEISTILKTIEIKKGSAFSKKEKVKNIFDDYSIKKLTPYIVQAFEQATPEQRVGFSFLVKDPHFIIRNDRLNMGWMWVEDGNLHIDFDLIWVKLSGDTDKKGYTAMRQVSKARGLRTSLETSSGMEYGDSTKELVIDRNIYTKITEERIKKEKELAEKGVDSDVKIEVVKDKTTKARLKELETLRKEKMISREEYERKRKAILGEL